MKCHVDRDEWYPVYSLYEDNTWGEEIDIPRELFEEWVGVLSKFEDLQLRLQELYKEVKKQKQLKECQDGIKSKGFD